MKLSKESRMGNSMEFHLVERKDIRFGPRMVQKTVNLRV